MQVHQEACTRRQEFLQAAYNAVVVGKFCVVVMSYYNVALLAYSSSNRTRPM